MLKTGENLGAFIVPTGIGASIGGYAGDASCYARKFAQYSKLIINPNVVNAACFSGITDNMLYVEGYTLDEFFKGNIKLKETKNNKIGVVFDKSIPKNILNIHINTINAVKTVYGTDIDYCITDEEVGVEFFITDNNISTGSVNNPETLKDTAEKLIERGANAIALVCLFDEPDDTDDNYAQGKGVDPVGGVEAILSHYISKELRVPCAHAPAFLNCEIDSKIVNPKAAAEYITPTFLPCILIGLANAPLLNGDIDINCLDYLVMPYNALGSIPVFEAIKRNIPVYAVRENVTELNITNEILHKSQNIIVVSTYEECLELIKKHKKKSLTIKTLWNNFHHSS